MQPAVIVCFSRIPISRVMDTRKSIGPFSQSFDELSLIADAIQHALTIEYAILFG